MDKSKLIEYASGLSFVTAGVTFIMGGPEWVYAPLILIPYFYLLFGKPPKNKTISEKDTINSIKSLNEIKKLISNVWGNGRQKEYFNLALAPKYGYLRFNSIHSAKALFKEEFPYELIREKTQTNTIRLSEKEKKMLSSNLFQMSAEDYFKWRKTKEPDVLKGELLHLISLFDNKKYQLVLNPVLLKYEITLTVLLNTLKKKKKIQNELPNSMTEKIINILKTFQSECNTQINKIDELELLKKNGELKSLEERIDFEKQFVDKVKIINDVIQ